MSNLSRTDENGSAFRNYMSREISVLRLGYRVGRDPRITTHLGLVARAFGANRFLLAGDIDESLFDNLNSVSERFGGTLNCKHIESPLGWLKKFCKDSGNGESGVGIHLTMYGTPYKETISKIPNDKHLTVVVGGAKVPAEIYDICQYNIAVGNQPHSEVAALALFLEELMDENIDELRFDDAKLKIIPSENGKNVIEINKE